MSAKKQITSRRLAETQEIVVQLQGDGGARQVEGVSVGFPVNSGKIAYSYALVYGR